MQGFSQLARDIATSMLSMGVDHAAAYAPLKFRPFRHMANFRRNSPFDPPLIGSVSFATVGVKVNAASMGQMNI